METNLECAPSRSGCCAITCTSLVASQAKMAGRQVRLTHPEDYRIGSLQVGQVRLEWRADELAQAHTWPLLEKKLLRGGG